MLGEVDIKRSLSYEFGHEDGQTGDEDLGEAWGSNNEQRAFVRQLLHRLDITQVATLLELSTDEVKLIVADGDTDDSNDD